MQECQNVKIFKYRNCFRIYPFYKMKWNKELRIEEGTCPKLEKAFYKVERFSRFFSRKDILHIYDRKNKTLSLPIGVGLEFIESKLYENNVLYEVVDKSDVVVEPIKIGYNFNENLTIRNQFQAESIDFLTTEKLFHSKMLSLGTGIGKTFCAISAAFRLKMPMFVVSETLCDQWMKSVLEYTDCDYKSVRIVKGTDNLHKLLSKPQSKVQIPFYISTSSTLSNYLEKYGSLNPLMQHLGIGILCFDEYHMNWAQNVQIEIDVQVLNIWRLTATPSRTDQNEKMIFNRTMTKIPVYGMQTRYLDNFHKLVYVDYDTCANYYQVQSCMTKDGLSAVKYWNYIFEDMNRMTYLLGMIKMIIDPIIDKYPDGKILVYLAKNEHIKRFIDMLDTLYQKENVKVSLGNYTTGVGNKHQKRREIRKHIILTTIGSAGVGLDLENLVATVCLVPYSSEITASQMIGRLRYIENVDLTHYDFIDESFKSMFHQRRTRSRILENKSNHIDKMKISYDSVMEYLNNIGS